MKKFNRREKTILRLMALVVAVAILSEVWESYTASRADLETSITSLESQISSKMRMLEQENATIYQEEADALKDDLEESYERVMEFSSETNASLLLRQTLNEKAEAAGMKITSIASRRSRTIDEERGLVELRVFFGWDAELSELLTFFGSLEDEEYSMVVDTLNITAVKRRAPRRVGGNTRNNRNRKNTTSRLRQRKALNGNSVIVTLFKENKDVPLDRYTVSVNKSPAVTKPAEDGGEGENPVIEPPQSTLSAPPPGDSLETKPALQPAKPPKTADPKVIANPSPTPPVTRDSVDKAPEQPKTLPPPPRPLTETPKPGKKNR